MNRLGIWMPFVILIIMIGAFGSQMDDKDPTALSPQIGKPMPDFTLPRLYDEAELTQRDIRGPAIINVFGSWCAACAAEHPIWKDIRKVIPVYGIAWRDDPTKTKRWLDQHGNPYSTIGQDQNSKFALDWGVTGAPENYVINSKGIIILKIAGQVTPSIWRNNILPRLEAEMVKAKTPAMTSTGKP